jgi:hypothetical protein
MRVTAINPDISNREPRNRSGYIHKTIHPDISEREPHNHSGYIQMEAKQSGDTFLKTSLSRREISNQSTVNISR